MSCPIPGHKDCPGYHPVIMEDEDWTWIQDTEHGFSITGKYLFFSSDRRLLVNIGKAEVGLHGFHRAKVSKNPVGEDVLCLYWENDSRKNELVERHNQTQNLAYRYWKTNKDTEAGNYSEQFLRKESQFRRD